MIVIEPKVKPSKRPNSRRKARYDRTIKSMSDTVCVCCLSHTCFIRFFLHLKGGDPLQSNASDAAALKDKVAAKKAKEAEAAGQSQASSATPVVPKKKVVKNNDFDDMLAAGLQAAKKRVK